jgi:hypothetical protein
VAYGDSFLLHWILGPGCWHIGTGRNRLCIHCSQATLMGATETNSSKLGGSHLVQFYSRSATTMMRDCSNTEGDTRLDRGPGSGHKPFLEAVRQEGVAVVSNDARSNAMHGSGSTAVVHGLACVTNKCSSDW